MFMTGIVGVIIVVVIDVIVSPLEKKSNGNVDKASLAQHCSRWYLCKYSSCCQGG